MSMWMIFRPPCSIRGRCHEGDAWATAIIQYYWRPGTPPHRHGTHQERRIFTWGQWQPRCSSSAANWPKGCRKVAVQQPCASFACHHLLHPGR